MWLLICWPSASGMLCLTSCMSLCLALLSFSHSASLFSQTRWASSLQAANKIRVWNWRPVTNTFLQVLNKHSEYTHRYKISNSASLSLSSWSCSSMTLFIQAASATALSLLAFSVLRSSTSPSSSAARILRSASWWTGKVLQSLSQNKLYTALMQNFSFLR